MDAMERSHTCESAVVSRLFDARQKIWTELSSVISDVKEGFDRSNKERKIELNRLVNENHTLSTTLKHLKEIIEGKELEINGLRRQLQSFCNGRPVCWNCSRFVDLTDNSRGADPNIPINRLPPHKLTLGEVRKRDRHNTSLVSDSTDTNHVNGHSDTAMVPWLRTGTGVPKRRPSQKRPCVRLSECAQDAQANVLIPDSNTGNDSFLSDQTLTNVPKGPDLAMNQSDSENNVKPLCPGGDKLGLASPTGSSAEKQLGLAELSPPSTSYNASLAIHNAVNHLDLANCENTIVESVQSSIFRADCDTANETCENNVQKKTVNACKNTSMVSRFAVRRVSNVRPMSKHHASRRFGLSLEFFRHHTHGYIANGVAASRHHKPTCRHARHSLRKAANQQKPTTPVECKPRDLDETGLDVSLPSDFLESERSPSAPPIRTDGKQAFDNPSGLSDCEKLLPSVGGSPTRDAGVFKRPKGPIPQIINNVASSARPRNSEAENPCPVVDSQETQLPEEVRDQIDVPSSTRKGQPSHQLDTSISDDGRGKENQYSNANEIHRTMRQSDPCVKKRYAMVKPVERRKSVRRMMPAHTCPTCQDYYKSLGLTDREVAERIDGCSKHRTVGGPPPSTPKGFWDLDISDCELSNDVREIQKYDSKKAHGHGNSTRRRRRETLQPCSHSEFDRSNST